MNATMRIYILFKNVKTRRGATTRLTRTLLEIIYGLAKIRTKVWVYLHVRERNWKRLNLMATIYVICCRSNLKERCFPESRHICGMLKILLFTSQFIAII